jgi:ribosomal protein S18 acetylase RimI-like enzyme
VATITTHRQAHPKLWNELEQAEPAVYAHRLVVNRDYAGLGIGASLLDWAAARAAREDGAEWIRLDVWNTNKALHAYYERLGFTYVRQADYDDCPSTTLFQRPIHSWPQPPGTAYG